MGACTQPPLGRVRLLFNLVICFLLLLDTARLPSYWEFTGDLCNAVKHTPPPSNPALLGEIMRQMHLAAAGPFCRYVAVAWRIGLVQTEHAPTLIC